MENNDTMDWGKVPKPISGQLLHWQMKTMFENQAGFGHVIVLFPEHN